MPKKKTILQRKSLEGRTTLKSSLLSPYILNWPVIACTLRDHILFSLTRIFGHKCSDPTLSTREEVRKHKQALFKNQVTFGVRSVTRGLEKDAFSLVLVCRSAQPSHLTTHLISLISTRHASGGSVPDLSLTLSPLLGLTSCLAVGFLRTADSPDIREFVADTQSQLPRLTLPWIHFKDKPEIEELKASGFPLPKDGSFIGTKICINKSTSKRKRNKRANKALGKVQKAA